MIRLNCNPDTNVDQHKFWTNPFDTLWVLLADGISRPHVAREANEDQLRLPDCRRRRDCSRPGVFPAPARKIDVRAHLGIVNNIHLATSAMKGPAIICQLASALSLVLQCESLP